MKPTVCLVIPARNAASTLPDCLEAVGRTLADGALDRAIVVDDGSTDATAEIAERFPVTCLRSQPRGRAAARNLGWRAAQTDLIWFMDADCVPASDALAKLLPHLEDPRVGAAGGSFRRTRQDAILPDLIHHEILVRHRAMGRRINFVATGNALYRRTVLEAVGGFDELFVRAEDADLAYRVRAAGYEIVFAPGSLVEHWHATQLWPYLRVQAHEGYWRLWLHLRHARTAGGDSYSSVIDNLQPPLAMLVLLSMSLIAWPQTRWVPVGLALMLAAAQLPMTIRCYRSMGSWRALWYAPMGFVRAFARGLGLTASALTYIPRKLIRRSP